MIHKILSSYISSHSSLRRVLLILLISLMGVRGVWSQTVSVWDGTVPSTAAVSKTVCNGIGITGSGTQTDPYVISTAGQFAYFGSKMNSDTNWWKLAENIEIDLDGANHEWTYGKNGWTFKGHFDGNGSTIKNMKITTTATGKGWGLFSNLQGVSATNHAEVKSLTIKDFQITTPDGGTKYAAAQIGLLVGKANGNTDIENITVTGGTIQVDVETTGANNVAGLVGQLATNENSVKNCTVSDVTITSGTAQKKEYYVGGIAGNASNRAVIVGNTVSNLTITLGGNTSGNNIIGGIVGKVGGVGSTASATLPMGNRSIVQHNTVEKPTITMNGSVVTANFYLGGAIGHASTHTNVFNNKVTSPTIALNNDINNTSYVGGAIGYQDTYTYVDGMTVNGTGAINGPTTDKTVKNGINFFVGGYVGYMVSSGTTKFQANKFKNVAVTGMDINMGHYLPQSSIQNHKFSVGGIAGAINAPNMTADYSWSGMPENLIFKGGKIYAPYASTSPIIAIFTAAVPAHNNMTLDVMTTVDAIEKAKSSTWYYNDYKLGLSSEFLSSTSVVEENTAPTKDKFRKNYSKATETIGGIKYLAIDNSTFTRYNRYQDSERDLKTVLWWTQQANYAAAGAAATAFTANEQPIYPNNAAATAGNATAYPYYWYFFQGVSHAKYASDADAANIVKGIEANVTNDVMPAVAMSSETNLNVAIINEGEARRGFDARTLSVTVNQGSTDVTSNYTYQWYVDGKASSSSTLTPHWKDGQGVTVNVLSGSTIVATASYGFAPGMLHTKASAEDATAESVRSDYNNRGTSANPYIIDCESALRQLSYLSTVHTNMFWETLGKPGTGYVGNQSQGHYNRAYYELSADIDLGNREFTPISHVGYGNDGSYGTYAQNWIFQGVFDGKGHAIKNLNITWGVSQYVGNNSNMYYGLFGCVGNSAAARKWGDTANGNTVIKNLVIDGATFTHNTSETSFYYDQSISTNANNCMVGVLAGIVTSYTTIQNIEIRGSKITDAGSQDYSLAGKGLYVGGAIGSVQAGFGAVANAPTSTTTQHIAAQVDITLTHPTIAKESDATQTGSFNVGGILGRYVATGASKAQVDPTAPAYTIYSGKIDAPKAWISPVVASMRYSAQQGFAFNNHSKHWEGNNLTIASQVTITNALYYDFYIGSTKITDNVPSNTCGMESRTMTAHSDGTDAAGTYAAQKYQGVNYGATWVISYGDALTLLNPDPKSEYHWVWEDGFVHFSTDPYIDAILSRDGNDFTATLVGGIATAYRWMISFDSETWHEVTDVTVPNYTVPASPKEKNVKALISDGEKEYSTIVMKVDALTDFCAPSMSSTDDAENRTYTVNMNAADPSAIAHLTIAYEWKDWNQEVIPGETGISHTISQDDVAQNHEMVWCVITLTEFGEVMAEYTLMGGGTVIYVNGYGYTRNGAQPGNDSNDGLTPQTPVLTIDQANSLLKTPANGGTWDNNIIVVMGILDNDAKFQSSGRNPATLTGKWNGIDYEGVIKLDQVDPVKPDGKTDEHLLNIANQPGKKGSNCYVLGDTKFENLVIYGNNKGNCFIELHGHDAVFGKGLVMQNFNKLSKNHGNFGEVLEVPEFTIILMATNINENDVQAYTRNRTKPQVVTFQSGHYGRIMAGRYTQNFFANADNTSHSILGSAEAPLWAVINIEIGKDNETTDKLGKNYSCDINAVIAGLTDGTMYGDMEINFRGGDVAYIVGSNQGNAINNGDAQYIPIGSTNTSPGKYGQWPNSSYFGRTIINIEQDPNCKNVTVGNLYAGGLGRIVQGDKAAAPVDMYLYGRTEVNVKSGTVGSVYGGGVGGVIGLNPWDAHVPYDVGSTVDNATNAIHNGVQYGDTRQGSWSSLVAGTAPMAKVTLRDYNEADGTFTTEILDLSESSTTVNVTGGTINGSVYGGGYGNVPDMPAESVVQGVGSVFGTSNINISGGNISGSVYGGSQGASDYLDVTNTYGQTIKHIAEMNGKANVNITGTDAVYPIIGGSIYGGGQGIESASATQEYLRIATAGNNNLGTEFNKDYSTEINITIDMPESIEFPNDIYGGGALGLVDGNTNIVLKRGNLTGNIYGGGFGELQHRDKARVTGTTNIYTGDISFSAINRNVPVSIAPSETDAVKVPTIYGGGNMAQVTGNTYINLWHGNISADVYGGGRGLTEAQSAGYSGYGWVIGNTRVLYNNITTSNKLTGNVYGGGALGAVQGNTTVIFKAGEIEGNIFGGGQGEEGSEKAKVTGNTEVIVDSSRTEPTTEP